MELRKRLKYGDLRDRYLNEVIYGDHEERVSFITVVNIMCGNADISCAYASSAVGWLWMAGKSFMSFSVDMINFV